MTFAESLRTWIRDPIIAPLFVILTLSIAVLALTVWIAVRGGTFNVRLFPRFLVDHVLAEFVPLAVLAFLVWIFGWAYPEGERNELETFGLATLGAAYGAGCLAVIGRHVRKILELVGAAAPAARAEAATGSVDGGPR